jgi:hypothetical protein
MAAGPSKQQAREFTYKNAKRVVAKLQSEDPTAVVQMRLKEKDSWCPAYLIKVIRHPAEGPRTVERRVVRLIRASNGEAAVITEVADAS